MYIRWERPGGGCGVVWQMGVVCVWWCLFLNFILATHQTRERNKRKSGKAEVRSVTRVIKREYEATSSSSSSSSSGGTTSVARVRVDNYNHNPDAGILWSKHDDPNG